MFEKCRLEGKFKLSSGKETDVFYDFDLLTPAEQWHYANLLYETYLTKVHFDYVVAPAIGGIVPGYIIAYLSNKPLIIVEENGTIRGPKPHEGASVIIIDDVVSTYSAVRKVLDALPFVFVEAVASYIFRGEKEFEGIQTLYLDRKEPEE